METEHNKGEILGCLPTVPNNFTSCSNSQDHLLQLLDQHVVLNNPTSYVKNLCVFIASNETTRVTQPTSSKTAISTI